MCCGFLFSVFHSIQFLHIMNTYFILLRCLLLNIVNDIFFSFRVKAFVIRRIMFTAVHPHAVPGKFVSLNRRRYLSSLISIKSICVHACNVFVDVFWNGDHLEIDLGRHATYICRVVIRRAWNIWESMRCIQIVAHVNVIVELSNFIYCVRWWGSR